MQNSRILKIAKWLLFNAILFYVLFVFLSVLVFSGQTQGLDLKLAQVFHSITTVIPIFFLQALAFWGAPGDYLIAIALFWYLMVHHCKKEAFILAFCLLGSELQLEIIKVVFQRPRPHIFPDIAQLLTFSFPSGHAQTSLAFYGLVAYLITRNMKSSFKLWGVRLGLLLFAFFIGIERVVEGVHWPTDVLAGFLYGIAWLSIYPPKRLLYGKRTFGFTRLDE